MKVITCTTLVAERILLVHNLVNYHTTQTEGLQLTCNFSEQQKVLEKSNKLE